MFESILSLRDSISLIDVLHIKEDWTNTLKIKCLFFYTTVRISISSDHCVYPPNETPDTITTPLSAIYRPERR